MAIDGITTVVAVVGTLFLLFLLLFVHIFFRFKGFSVGYSEGVRIVLDNLATKRGQGDVGKFEMLLAKGNAYDGDAE